jgi:hypothetical protein
MNNPNNEISDEALATLIREYINGKIKVALPPKPKEPKKPPLWKGFLGIVGVLTLALVFNLFFHYLKYN